LEISGLNRMRLLSPPMFKEAEPAFNNQVCSPAVQRRISRRRPSLFRRRIARRRDVRRATKRIQRRAAGKGNGQVDIR